MNKLKSILAERISKHALKKGVKIRIGDISLIKGISLNDVSIQIREEKAFVGSLRIGINLKALLRKRMVTTIRCKDIALTSKHLSEKEFNIETAECKISYDSKLKEIASDILLNQEIEISLRSIGNPESQEYFLKVKDLSIDKYKRLFDVHILSQFMGNLYSNSSITILCYYKCGKATPYPKINSAFQYDSLILNPDNYILSKEYILHELSKRNRIAREYKRYEEIPEIIRRTIISTEDPSFELHKGICPVLMGLTLRANINRNALERGGSTISMQLIKNALLNSERTMCRKIEEAILTLLMENYYHISKQDILEAYLNMIEFAPDVYGIEDAAKFYFGKSSAELSIIEVIVLTYIIPRPIHFYEALLLKTEQLQRNLHNHIKHYLSVVLHKKIVTQDVVRPAEIKQIKFTERFGTLLLEP